MSKTKLQIWHEMSMLLKETKTREAELRRELCADFLDGSVMAKGRTTVKGHEGHLDFTAVQALTYSLDASVLSTLWPHLTDVDKLCVVYKPSLSQVPYKKLDQGSLLHEAVSTKLAMPTLKVEVNDGYQE